jgi:hypothetical protein
MLLAPLTQSMPLKISSAALGQHESGRRLRFTLN